MQDLADERGVPFQEVSDEWKMQASLRTFIEPDEIANLVLYLCSPLSAGITGAIVPIDGHLETLVG